MTICGDEAVTRHNDAYWIDDDAAQPVLLVDEATEAITEALHRVRSGAMLDGRDLAAAGVALSDLFGGLGQLADSLASSAGKCAETDPLQLGRLADRLEILRAMTLSAQEGGQRATAGERGKLSDQRTSHLGASGAAARLSDRAH